MASRWRVFDDLDQVRELIAHYDADHERDVLGREPFRWAIWHRDGSRAQLAHVRASPQRVGGTPRAFLLHIPQEGRHTYRVGERTVETSPGQAVLFVPGQTFTSWSAQGTRVSVRLEEEALRQEAADQAGLDNPGRVAVDSMIPLHMPAGREIESLISARVLAASPGGSDRDRYWEADVIAAVARVCLEVSGSDGPDRASEERRRVRKVEEWIDAHFSRPITLGELCRVAGLPARTLHRAFLRCRGVPPMRHVVQRRLAEARGRLLEGHPGDSVMQVALESGFTHLGRFAGLYRDTYGELPSQSLRAPSPGGARRPAQKA